MMPTTLMVATPMTSSTAVVSAAVLARPSRMLGSMTVLVMCPKT